MSSTQKKIEYGEIDIPESEFNDPKKTKVRITIMLDGAVLAYFKALAEKEGGKYQTIINATLSEVAYGSRLRLEERMAKIEKQFEERMSLLFELDKRGKLKPRFDFFEDLMRAPKKRRA